MPPPSGLLGRAQEAVANASARSTARQAMETERLRRATEALNQQTQRANEIAREHIRLQRAGDTQGAQQAATAFERQTRRTNAALEDRNRILDEQGALARRASQSMQAAGRNISNGITNITTAGIVRMRAQIERAHHALLQNTRRFEDINATGLANAITSYEGALAQAMKIGIKYGQSVDELTQIQHSLVDVMNIDVSQGGWVDSVSAITEDFASMASRAGRTVAEVAAAQMEMSQTFGRGSQAEMAAFANQMTRVSMIPEVLRQRLEAAGQQAGMVFSNREMAIQIEEWTRQFGDQAMSIEEMTANMMAFRNQATAAGHSVRTINAVNNAFAAGTVGRHGTDVNTVRAGQQLAERFNSDEAFRDRVLGNMRRPDGTANTTDQQITSQIAADAGRGNAMAASDLYHMLQGTTEGIQAITDSMVGFYDQPLWKATRMMQQQGFDTGRDDDNQRLAFLLQQRHETGTEANSAEINQLMAAAGQRSTEQARAQADQYVNVAVTATAAEQTAEAAQQLVQNTSFGGPLVAAITGVAAVMAATNPALAHEWEDIFMGRVSANTGDQARSQTNAETVLRQNASVAFTRQRMQDISEADDFDLNSRESRDRLAGVVSRARRDTTDAQFQSVIQKLHDLGYSDTATDLIVRHADTLATSGHAGEGDAENSAQYREALQAAARRGRTVDVHAQESAAPRLDAVVARDRERAAAAAASTTPSTTNRTETANQVIQQGATPASTPASTPTPPAPAPAPTAASSTMGTGAMLQAAPANVTPGPNGSWRVPINGIIYIQNADDAVAGSHARNNAVRPIGG